MSHALASTLASSLAKRVAQDGIVLWLDPTRAFASMAGEIDIDDTTVLRSSGSLYALQHEAEKLLALEERPRVVVYLPGVESAAGTPLHELAAIGGTFKEALPSLAFRALQAAGMPKARIDELLAIPNLTPELIEDAVAVEVGVPEQLRPMFGGASPEDILAATLGGGPELMRVQDAGVAELLADYTARLVGIAPPAPRAMLDALWSRVLMTEFVFDLRGAAVPADVHAQASTDRVTQKLCVAVAHKLRDRGGDAARKRYEDQSAAVVARLGLDQLPIDPLALGDIDTFAFEERRVLARAVELALEGEVVRARDAIAKRRGTFWLRHDLKRQATWTAASLALDLIEQAAAARAGLLPSSAGPGRWVAAYVDGNEKLPLVELDRLARRVEREASAAEFRDVAALVEKARDEHFALVEETTRRFVESVERWGWDPLLDLPQQRATYRDVIAPYVGEEPIAYLLCDAFRYDMACDLREMVEAASAKLEARVATLPTVTEVGMTALMPGAEQGVELVFSGTRLGVRIGPVPVFDRSGREGLLKQQLGPRVRIGNLDDLLFELRPPTGKRAAKAKPLPSVLVGWHCDVDSLGESGSREGLRIHFASAVERLARCVRELGDLGYRRVVVTADHGHVLTERAGREMAIDTPAGASVEVKRRHWLGRGARTNSDVLVLDAAQVGIGGDLQIAVPRGLGVFRPQASMAFFHGGLSLHELLVPVLTFTFGAAAKDDRSFSVEAKPGAGGSGELLLVSVTYRRALFSEEAADVCVLGTHAGEIVTRVEFGQGKIEGTDVVRVNHKEPSLCMLRLLRPVVGTLRLEVRTRDGGRILNLSQTPFPEVDVRYTPPTAPGAAAMPAPAVVAPAVVVSLAATEIELRVQGAAQPRRVDLRFEANADERAVLVVLARDGSITERAANKVLGRKGSGLLLSELLEKLVQHGHSFMERGDDGDEGAEFSFRREYL